MKPTHLYLAVALILIFQVGQLYFTLTAKGPNADLLNAIEASIDRNNAKIEAGNAEIKAIVAERNSLVDTLKVIEKQKTTIRENYYHDVSRILANDSTQRFLQYRNDIAEAHEWLLSGRYFE